MYWGHVMPGVGTPNVKIQVIDLLEHLIGMGTVSIACARAKYLQCIKCSRTRVCEELVPKISTIAKPICTCIVDEWA